MPKKITTVLKKKPSVESFSTMTTTEQNIMTIEELRSKIDSLFKLTEKMFITV